MGLADKNIRHLEDLMSEDMWKAVQVTAGNYETWRNQHGDRCRLIFDELHTYLAGYKPRTSDDESVVATVLFYTKCWYLFDPSTVQYRCDELTFQASYTKDEDGNNAKL